MPIRAKPKIGDIVIINKSYFVDNYLISQYFDSLAPAVQYEVVEVVELVLGLWGINKLKNVETGEILDISTVDELKDYWCFLTDSDSYRVVPQ